MKCPHCGEETPAERPQCAHCGRTVQIVAGSVFDAQPTEDQGTDWGPRLLRYCIGLGLLACVLGFGANFLRDRPLTKSEIEEPPLTAPEPALPMPKPPQRLPEAPLIQPAAVALTARVPRIRMAFGSRDPRLRQLFLERNGGDERTELAVERGLKWLSSAQADDGSWNYKKYGIDDKYKDSNYSLGVSGLALLAFLGAGHTHQDKGPYKELVAKAIDFILKGQRADGLFPGPLYHQGICTMALAEAYGMTGDTTLEPPTRRAVEAIVKAQAVTGGWDYSPSTPDRPRHRSDTSVTGWQIMALKSAKKAGIDSPAEVYEKMKQFINGVARPDGHIGYTNMDQNPHARPAMTAVGLNVLLIAAVDRNDRVVQNGVAALLKHLPRLPQPRGDGWHPRADIYLWYHGSLVLSRLRGREWQAWNNRLKATLLPLQEPDGELAGSFRPRGDPWVGRGGRVYFTALAVLSLEVYYRYD